MKPEDIQPGFIVRLADGELAAVLGVGPDSLTASKTASHYDAVTIDRQTAIVVFPTDEHLADILTKQGWSGARASAATGGLDGRDSIPRMTVGKICDAALAVKFTWPEGRQIYDLVRAVYDGVKFNPLR